MRTFSPTRVLVVDPARHTVDHVGVTYLRVDHQTDADVLSLTGFSSLTEPEEHFGSTRANFILTGRISAFLLLSSLVKE